MALGTKSEVLNHSLINSEWERLVLSLVSEMFATVISGRSLPMALKELSSSANGVNGKPDCQFVMKLRFHPLTALSVMPFTGRWGKAYIPDSLKTLVASPASGP